jgi:hypothetical protein
MDGMAMAEGMDMADGTDMPQAAAPLCDCASFQCAGGQTAAAVFGPVAILPSIVAIEPFLDAGEGPSGSSPAAIRLAASPLSPPPRA